MDADADKVGGKLVTHRDAAPLLKVLELEEWTNEKANEVSFVIYHLNASWMAALPSSMMADRWVWSPVWSRVKYVNGPAMT